MTRGIHLCIAFYSEALPVSPVIGEFWFLALAAANIQAPPMVAHAPLRI